MLKSFAILAGALVAQMSFAWAFDFESVAYGTYTNPLVLTSADNTLTVTSEGGVLWLSDPSVAALGLHSVSGFANTVNYGNNRAMKFSLANAVNTISFAFGDNGGDDDGNAVAYAYDANDVLLGSVSSHYGASDLGGSMLLNYTGMKSFRLTTESYPGGTAQSSIFWEVSSYNNSQPVPEPASLLALGTGLVALVRRRKAQ